MEITPFQRKVQASDVAPERLAGNPRLSEEQKVREASRQFEAVLVRQILTDAQKPVIRTKLTTETASSSIYRDLITTRLADTISKSGELGFAQTFESQLTRQAGAGDKSQTKAGATPDAAVTAKASSNLCHPPRWPFADSVRQFEARQARKAVPAEGKPKADYPSIPAKNTRLRTTQFGPALPSERPLRVSNADFQSQAKPAVPTTALHGAGLLISKP